jgi:MarR family transcriptional regulator, organic hydroperoxide resistance regulator
MEDNVSQTSRSKYDELLRTIAQSWLMFRQKGKKMLAEMNYDLTFEQILVLQILEEEDGLMLGVLAEKADRERTTISRMVDGLEKRNLAIRISDKTDKRQKLVYLTKLGKKRNAEMAPLIEKFIQEAFSGVQNKNIEVTLETLKAIFGGLKKG